MKVTFVILEIVSKLKEGAEVAAFPAFGCATQCLAARGDGSRWRQIRRRPRSRVPTPKDLNHVSATEKSPAKTNVTLIMTLGLMTSEISPPRGFCTGVVTCARPERTGNIGPVILCWRCLRRD